MIAIKGMKEMPKTCSECDFCHVHICKRTGIDIITNPKSGCPLVEIITCKECKYTRQNENNDRYCDLSGRYYDPDYYCAYAERRE